MSISFTTTREETDLIAAICQRAESLGWERDRMGTVMDLAACHANGCPLDFQRMSEADNFNLMHDVAGIARHIDRTTGKLTDCFLPRFAKREAFA